MSASGALLVGRGLAGCRAITDGMQTVRPADSPPHSCEGCAGERPSPRGETNPSVIV